MLVLIKNESPKAGLYLYLDDFGLTLTHAIIPGDKKYPFTSNYNFFNCWRQQNSLPTITFNRALISTNSNSQVKAFQPLLWSLVFCTLELKHSLMSVLFCDLQFLRLRVNHKKVLSSQDFYSDTMTKIKMTVTFDLKLQATPFISYLASLHLHNKLRKIYHYHHIHLWLLVCI